jgi:hypothetical protein
VSASAQKDKGIEIPNRIGANFRLVALREDMRHSEAALRGGLKKLFDKIIASTSTA